MSGEYPAQHLKCIDIPDWFQMPIEMFAVQQYVREWVDYVMIPNGMIQDRVEKLAEDIYRAYRMEKDLTFIVVLNGADLYFNDLMFNMQRLITFDQGSLVTSIEYVKVKTYVNDQAMAEAKVEGLKSTELITGRNILIVEDIYDTGKSMARIIDSFRKMEPKSMKVSVLLHKKNPENLKFNWKADFCGFAVPHKFVIGYYMDYNNLFREIPHLCVLSDKGIKNFRTQVKKITNEDPLAKNRIMTPLKEGKKDIGWEEDEEESKEGTTLKKLEKFKLQILQNLSL